MMLEKGYESMENQDENLSLKMRELANEKIKNHAQVLYDDIVKLVAKTANNGDFECTIFFPFQKKRNESDGILNIYKFFNTACTHVYPEGWNLENGPWEILSEKLQDAGFRIKKFYAANHYYDGSVRSTSERRVGVIVRLKWSEKTSRKCVIM